MSNKLNTQVRAMEFFRWIVERHRIYLRRSRGDPWPWTSDPILRDYKFTNVFRELDRTTVELRERLKPHRRASLDLILFNICLFRLFNYTPTYDALGGWQEDWGLTRAKRILGRRYERGEQLITGAYMVAGRRDEPKYETLLQACSHIWRSRDMLVKLIRRDRTIESTVAAMSALPTVGRFVAYELATDFRHTRLLRDATDIMTWANPGPGAKKGLNIVFGRPLKYNPGLNIMIQEMQWLLKKSRKVKLITNNVPPMEMRDIEHSLCEFSKWVRIRAGGHGKSKYKPRIGES